MALVMPHDSGVPTSGGGEVDATFSNGNGEMNFNAWSCSAPEAGLPKSSRQAGTSPIRHMLYQIFSD